MMICKPYQSPNMQRQLANSDELSISSLMVPPSNDMIEVVHRYRTVLVRSDEPIAYTPGWNPRLTPPSLLNQEDDDDEEDVPSAPIDRSNDASAPTTQYDPERVLPPLEPLNQ